MPRPMPCDPEVPDEARVHITPFHEADARPPLSAMEVPPFVLLRCKALSNVMIRLFTTEMVRGRLPCLHQCAESCISHGRLQEEEEEEGKKKKEDPDKEDPDKVEPAPEE